MMVTSIYRNFQLVKFTNLQIRWESSKEISQTYESNLHGGVIRGSNTVNATSMHSTSYWESLQKKTELQHPARIHKTARPQKFPHCRNPLISSDWMPTLISARGASLDTLHVKGFQCPARKCPNAK